MRWSGSSCARDSVSRGLGAVNIVSSAEAVAPAGSRYATVPLKMLETTQAAGITVSSDKTSLRVARAGLYLVMTKGVVHDAATGDVVHFSLLQDGKSVPRMNAQTAVQSIWDQVSGCEVVRLEPSQVLRLGYCCEQGGGSKVISGSVLCLVYLGA